MAFNPLFKMSMQDSAGDYLQATLNNDCTWTVSTTPTLTYIEVLPDGWDKTTVTFERDMSFIGVFRSMSSNGAYNFTMDARAIIQNAFANEGVQAEITFKIWMLNSSNWGYDLFYPSQFDFKTYSDDQQNDMLNIHTLDNGLIRDWHAWGDTSYNTPIWHIYPVSGQWVTDAHFLIHDGIKLLYNATYTSSATPSNILKYQGSNGNDILGFNLGNHGAPPNDGYHTILTLQQYNIVQNNGATTYIGNDILANLIIQGNQTVGIDKHELNFAGVNESRPYKANNFSIKNVLPNAASSFDMWVAVSGKFDGNIDVGDSGTGQYLGFAMFEIDEFDQAKETFPTSGLWTKTDVLKYALPNTAGTFTPSAGGVFSSYSAPVTVTLQYGKVYIFALVWDLSLIHI